ncbi:hypothetical protein THII_2108 [Thioploca ingrica]|uniref:Uncharacterized protein n=1 Tax=Thioploca ingrica TaxID=40754 RepID=A0A090AME7_9GAMM|nr:hypothetical protein THII_2108 [Thioploca ingrica]
MRINQANFTQRVLKLSNATQVVKRPPFIIYRPHHFALNGTHTREIMELVEPGDILVRYFNHYLSRLLIRGTFTHVGFYLGEVNETHLKQLAKIDNPDQFKLSKQMVIHTSGDQVYLEDIIDFCRCDGLAVMRFPRQLKPLTSQSLPENLQAYFANPTQVIQEAIPIHLQPTTEDNKGHSAKPESSLPAPHLDAAVLALIKAEKDIAHYLVQGKGIEFEKIFKILYRLALRELTAPHPYRFNIEPFYLTACTELVYFITKSIAWNYGIEPQLARLFFKQRYVIMPDVFVDSNLEEIWKVVG